MGRSIIYSICMIILAMAVACSNFKTGVPDEKLDFGYSTYSILVRDMGKLLAERKKAEFTRMMLTRDSFEKYIYGSLPEGTQKNPMPVDDYWLMTTGKTGNAILEFFNYFNGSKKIEFVTMKDPVKVKKFDNITIYYRIPVTFKDENNRTKTYNNIFSTVVCKDHLCRLWSVDVED